MPSAPPEHHILYSLLHFLLVAPMPLQNPTNLTMVTLSGISKGGCCRRVVYLEPDDAFYQPDDAPPSRRVGASG
jgi:hypothetical protein